MKKRFWGIAAALVLALCLTQATALAAAVPGTQWKDYAADAFAGGTGTEADPYLIETPAQLAKLAKDVSNRQDYAGAYFRLEADLDLSAHRWNPIGVFAWQPSGATASTPFRGFLDGNNKKITGLIVSEKNGKNAAGLFGSIRKSSANGKTGVQDLTIKNAYIEASDDGLMESSAGILAGYVLANDGCTIEFTNVTVSGTMRMSSDQGFMIAGGLLGNVSRATVKGCQALDMDIQANSNSGGFVGMDDGSQYQQCRATGKLSGTWTLGGFAGYGQCSDLNNPSTSASSFTRCYADVDVTGDDWRLGGFAGLLENGRIENSAAMGDVKSKVTDWEPRVGALVGEATNATINRSHSASKLIVKRDDSVGGVSGRCDGVAMSEVSFDIEKNPDLKPFGTMAGDASGSAARAESQKVLSNICRDYYFGGHIWGDKMIVDREPTCAEEGLKSKHCQRCDEHGAEEIIPKTEDHQFAWVIDRQPAVGVAGSKHEECKVCGLKKDPVEIPALSDGSYDVPRTGDQANLLLWAAALLLGTGLLISAKKKAHI